MFGIQTPTLRKLAMRILSQTASSSACERNWSTFALVHTKQRNRLAYKRLEELVFCSYNMKLQLRDIQSDAVDRKDPLDMIQRSMEVMGDNVDDDELLQWIRPVHLDDEDRNPDPNVASPARAEGVDVDTVLSEDVGHTSHGSSDDGRGPNDGDDGGDGGDFGGYPASQDVGGGSGGGGSQHYDPWTMEQGYQATQDSDHGSRRQRSDRLVYSHLFMSEFTNNVRMMNMESNILHV